MVAEAALVEEEEEEEVVGGASVDEEEGGAGVDSEVGEDSGAGEGSEEEEEGDGTRLIVRINWDVFFRMLQHLDVNMYEIDMTKGAELRGAREGHLYFKRLLSFKDTYSLLAEYMSLKLYMDNETDRVMLLTKLFLSLSQCNFIINF